MDVINAIAKVRFNSARPQRVQLHRCPDYACDLVCLEPGQELSGTGRCGYYVIAGSGQMKAGAGTRPLSMGSLASCDERESYTLVNSSEQRLICLAISNRS